MQFKDFKETINKFLIQNYNFKKKKTFLVLDYKDFQLIVWIVKSIYGEHYKILSNFYVPELHSFEELISLRNCEKKIHEDLQSPEDLFSKEFLLEKQDKEILDCIQVIFDEIIMEINKKGIKFFYEKKLEYLYEEKFLDFIKQK